MPIYLYKCEDCNTNHEFLQRFSDPAFTECPSCGGRLHKQFSPEIGFNFKGSGFYITDYKKSSSADNSSKGETHKAKETSTESDKVVA